MFVLISIFLLQFLMKFADRLVGKGLSTWVIVKLISFNMAWMVVLVVPMAVLVATLMAFGSMAQNNEIAIFKASGISLYRMIAPPFIASIVLFYLLIQFNNNVYPDANHAARILMQDINRKKPTLMLVPGVFSQDIQNYSILAREIDPKTNELKNLTIYDYSVHSKITIITAEKGRIFFSKDLTKLLMDLYNGEMHESNLADTKPYRKVNFERQRIAMDAGQFTFQQSDPGGRRSDRELGAQDMIVIVDSLTANRIRYTDKLETSIGENLIKDIDLSQSKYNRYQTTYKNILLRVENKIKTSQNIIRSNLNRLQINKKEINNYWVEIHKKYSIPAVCIVFVLIGASLGTMTRKGGFGVAAGISMLFFLIYWAFLIGGEKFADRGLLSPFWGMWSANILLGVLGIILVIKTSKERISINFDWFNKLIPKQFRIKQETDADS